MSAIARWLESLGLGHLVEIFLDSRIDADILSDLTGDDLKELGIPLGDRKRLLKAIADGFGAPVENPAAPEPLSLSNSENVGSPRPELSSEPPESNTAELRQVTIVFVDLVGSTDLASRLDPETVAALMTRYEDCCVSVVNKWSGHVAEFLGDGAVIYFGWPTAHEQDAERAVSAALECVDAVGKIGFGNNRYLAARAGIATGKVMVGDIRGRSVPGRDAVIGEAPNIAARIQSVAEPGSVVITSDSRRLIGDRFELASLGDHTVKGIDRAITLWKVIGVRNSSRFDARTRGELVPMVGRDTEFATLCRLWDQGAAGSGVAALIVGEAGIGKSRLARAVAEHVSLLPQTSVNIQCSPYHASTPLLPVVDWVKRELSLGSCAVTSRSLESYIFRARLNYENAVPLLAELLSIPLANDAPLVALSPQLRRSQTIEVLTDLMLRSADGNPVLIVVEDLQWADPTTLELLHLLIAKLGDRVPGLLLMTSRTAAPAAFAGDVLEAFELTRLETSATIELIKELSGDEIVDEGVVRLISRSADGVPLFIEELTLTLAEGGHLGGKGEKDNGGTAVDELDVPTSLQELLLARLDALESSKPIAQLAATVGRSFPESLLIELAESFGRTLGDALRELCDAGILYQERHNGLNATYAFRHALMREAAYRSQLKASRRKAHLTIAGCLEASYPMIVQLEPELLAHHYAEGGNDVRAAEYLLTAGQKAVHSSATHEAISHLKAGLALLDPLPNAPARDRTELLLYAMLGTANMQARGWGASEVEQAYAAAAALTHAAESVAEEIWILWGVWVHHEVCGRINQATEVSKRIEWVADQNDDLDSRLVADMVSLQILFYAGRFRESRRHGEAFLHNFDSDRHHELRDRYSSDLAVVCYVHLALDSWISGDTAHAHHLCALASAVACEIDYPFSTAWNNTWGAVIDLLEGHSARIQSRTTLGIGIAEEQGFPYVAALGRMMAGWAAGQVDPLEGAALLRDAMMEFRATGAEIVVPFFQTLLAELLIRGGKANQALEALARARNQIDEDGERWQEAEVYRMQGNAYAIVEGGSSINAEASYRRALEIAEAQGAQQWLHRAAVDYAEFLAANGRNDEAKSFLAYSQQASSA